MLRCFLSPEKPLCSQTSFLSSQSLTEELSALGFDFSNYLYILFQVLHSDSFSSVLLGRDLIRSIRCFEINKSMSYKNTCNQKCCRFVVFWILNYFLIQMRHLGEGTQPYTQHSFEFHIHPRPTGNYTKYIYFILFTSLIHPMRSEQEFSICGLMSVLKKFQIWEVLVF